MQESQSYSYSFLNKHFGAEITIFQVNKVNTMAADDLAPSVARSSAHMLSTMQTKTVNFLASQALVS